MMLVQLALSEDPTNLHSTVLL